MHLFTIRRQATPRVKCQEIECSEHGRTPHLQNLKERERLFVLPNNYIHSLNRGIPIDTFGLWIHKVDNVFLTSIFGSDYSVSVGGSRGQAKPREKKLSDKAMLAVVSLLT